ncbi:TonB-dependent receptor [Rhizomicrobium palustre]
MGAEDLLRRPILRPGEVVEDIPGVIVTQHSGSGKANQYFLRGFNLDHGTDLAISLDGVGVNLPSHAHGQGYADLNFLIPELVERVAYKKGPYYADVGDFGAAGAFDIRYFNRLPGGLARLEGGSGGYGRLLLADNADIAGGTLLYAGEIAHDDGPWTRGDDARKFNGVLRFTDGRFTLSAEAYHNRWNSTDQVPDRAIASGLISRWGNIDSSDGGMTGRYALRFIWQENPSQEGLHILAFAERRELTLFSNFTYFLNDPVHGDQIAQKDARYVLGGKISYGGVAELLGAENSWRAGLDLRSDIIRAGLFHSERRKRLYTTHDDDISETMVSPFAESEFRWTPWLRTTLGVRSDFLFANSANLAGGDSGQVQSASISPKAGLAIGPFAKTELYANLGFGLHSNDIRGVVAKADPATALVRGKGGEVGLRTGFVDGLQSTLSIWFLDLKSELVWAGDSGTNEPSGPTRRYGVEFANTYAPTPWLSVDFDYAWSRARYTNHDPVGRYVPEAIAGTIDGGVALHDLPGAWRDWSGSLRVRYFGPRVLTQDGSLKSKGTSLLYLNLGYAISARWSAAMDIFNLLDSRVSDIDYFYTSRLPGEPLKGVDDIHTHPAEPRQFRVSVTAAL